MNNKSNTLPAFSIIEVLIGIFVFSLGLVSIYALLASSLKISDYNNNAIIASNLAREQVELLRNIRDTNYKKLQVWNQQRPQTGSYSDVFMVDNYYTLANNFTTGNIDIVGIPDPSGLGPSDIFSESNIDHGRLCLDIENRYVYCSGGDIKQKFARYLYIQQAKDELGADIENAFVATSKVIWYKRGYYEYEISTIITDWRRI